MKINILVAGMRYACPEHEDYVQTTEWLGKEQPEVIMVMKTNNHYGTTIVVKNGNKELGKVSRCHLEGLLSLMHSRKKKMLFGTAKTVDSDGGFFNVSLELTAEEQALFDTAARGRNNRETWAGWEWTGGPLMGALEEDLDTEASINMLDAILEDDWQGREDLIVDTLKSLVNTARYDISDETAQAFYRFRQLLTEHPSRQLRAYEPIFTKAMNDYGSAARQKEFATTFAARIINSEEARLMMQDWIDTHDVDPDDNAQMQELIDQELQRIDEALKALPFNLYHDRNDIGLLMNHLVYKNIPRKQWQMLSSLLVMKYHLMEMWDEFCPEPIEERIDTPEAQEDKGIFAQAAMPYWEALKEQGFVDADLKRTEKMNNQTTMFVAMCFAEKLGLRSRWKEFEKLWHVKHLAQEHYRMTETGRMPAGHDIIDEIFSR